MVISVNIAFILLSVSMRMKKNMIYEFGIRFHLWKISSLLIPIVTVRSSSTYLYT